MLSLADRIRLLEDDLLAIPPRIAIYRELPFAILRYDPAEEWTLRHEVSLLTTRFERAGRVVRRISMSELLWYAVDHSEGMEPLVDLEVSRGFDAAQEQLTTYLSNPLFSPLAGLVADRLQDLDPERSIAFLVRASAMGPSMYPMSRLLEELQGKTMVPTVLFYPGGIEGQTGLRFMNLEERSPVGNYRVRIYGTE